MHTPHELPEMFPDEHAVLHRLKLENPHFVKLADSYHTLNRTIHRAETNVEPMADMALEDLKKQRLALLDEIRTMVDEAPQNA